MAKAKSPTKKAVSKAVSKATVRHPVSKETGPHPDTQKIEDLHKHIQERIADGGATTDHLKHMLTMIKPPEPETAPAVDETQNLTV